MSAIGRNLAQRRRALRRQFVLGRGSSGVLQLQLQLIEQALLAFGPDAVERTLQPLGTAALVAPGRTIRLSSIKTVRERLDAMTADFGALGTDPKPPNREQSTSCSTIISFLRSPTSSTIRESVQARWRVAISATPLHGQARHLSDSAIQAQIPLRQVSRARDVDKDRGRRTARCPRACTRQMAEQSSLLRSEKFHKNRG
jgi:hypothetical protein